MSQAQKSIQAEVPTRFTRLDGAVADSKTGLIWSLEETERLTWEKAQDHCASLSVLGFSDWHLPTCDELLTLVDRARISPAIDINFFPDCRSDWYWTSTPYAGSPGVYAWLVGFSYGFAGWGSQGLDFHVRAVRASQS